MGVASSSNTAQSIADITNSIVNSTQVDTRIQSECTSSTFIEDCDIKGGVEQKAVCAIVAKSSSVATSLSNSNIRNTIAQRLLQTAASQVGALGMGYADANNYISVYANQSTNVSSILSSATTQVSKFHTDMTCQGSVVWNGIKNDLDASSNMISNQVLKNDLTTRVSNSIDQKIEQKATSTVTGLSFMLIFALALFALLYGGMKAKDGATSGALFGMIGLLGASAISWSYAYQKPPFFDEPKWKMVSSTGETLGSKDSNHVEVIAASPFRYLWPMFGVGDVTLGDDPSANFSPGLIQVYIQNNHGNGYDKTTSEDINTFNSEFKQDLEEFLQRVAISDIQLDSVPDIIVRKNGRATTNQDAWRKWLKAPSQKNSPQYYAGVARLFFVSKALQNKRPEELNIRIFDWEPVMDSKSDIYMFTPAEGTTNLDLLEIVGSNGGTIKGNFGILQTPSWRLHQGAREKRKVISFAISIFILIMFFYKSKKQSLGDRQYEK